MSEKEKTNGNDSKNHSKRQSETNYEKEKFNEGFGKNRPIPKSWQPTRDDTDSTPPDGGSGVGDTKEK